MIPTDYGVEFAFLSEGREVSGILFERAVSGLGLAIGNSLSASDLLDGVLNALFGDAFFIEQSRNGRVPLGEDGQEDVLGRNRTHRQGD